MNRKDRKAWEKAVRKLTGNSDFTKCEGILDEQHVFGENAVRPVLYQSAFDIVPYKIGEWVVIRSGRVDKVMRDWFDNQEDYPLDVIRKTWEALKESDA